MGLLTPCLVPRGGVLYTMIVLGDGFCPLRVVSRGIILDETDSCISRRCKQAAGKYTISFGGISVILVADIAQLPPITDKKIVYHCKPCDELSTEGFCAYQKFDTVVKLPVIVLMNMQKVHPVTRKHSCSYT